MVAAYARSPIPEVSVEAFRENLKGGAIYAGQEGQSRRGWKSQVMWLPRASAAYQVNEGMVVKGGYGVYYDSLNATAITPNQLGFSTVTTVPSSNDFGQTWTSGNPRAGISPLVDPFPVRADGTRFSTPAGASLGGDFVAGQALKLTATSIVSTPACSGGVRACRKSSAATWRSRWRTSARIPTTSTSALFGNTNNTRLVRQDILPRAVLEPHEHAKRSASRPRTTETSRTRFSSAT